MRILGIDPGVAKTGYGMLIEEKGRMTLLASGEITTPRGKTTPGRLELIYSGVTSLLKELSPDVAVVEELFFNTNLKTAVEVGEARGVILLACEHASVRCEEYTPLEVKQAVVGNGNASKEQVKYMVGALLGLDTGGLSYHACDAIALAVCHVNFSRLEGRTRGRIVPGD